MLSRKKKNNEPSGEKHPVSLYATGHASRRRPGVTHDASP